MRLSGACSFLRFCFSEFLFFFNDTATTEIYPLSLHDALPISRLRRGVRWWHPRRDARRRGGDGEDRKSTRLNSSHGYISYAVFCLKKKKLTASSRELVNSRQPQCSSVPS